MEATALRKLVGRVQPYETMSSIFLNTGNRRLHLHYKALPVQQATPEAFFLRGLIFKASFSCFHLTGFDIYLNG